mmetsp:Transcript_48362/g.111986  ORF Transcript_48362/g.111986 Transcript_48362/m.111986 type:complete len:82 (-) Transcript_48362:1093-1338(-)
MRKLSEFGTPPASAQGDASCWVRLEAPSELLQDVSTPQPPLCHPARRCRHAAAAPRGERSEDVGDVRRGGVGSVVAANAAS